MHDLAMLISFILKKTRRQVTHEDKGKQEAGLPGMEPTDPVSHEISRH